MPELRERDFRSSEGTKFRSSGGSRQDRHSDAETYAEMRARVDRFIYLYLAPLFGELAGPPAASGSYESASLIVVAHGIILNVLLGSLLSRFAPSESSSLSSRGDEAGRAEWSVSWSNTGYVEAEISPVALTAVAPPEAEAACAVATELGVADMSTSRPLHTGVRLIVKSVNNVEHLQGLRKTKGGIGSATFDSKQKTVDSFFKPVGKRSS